MKHYYRNITEMRSLLDIKHMIVDVCTLVLLYGGEKNCMYYCIITHRRSLARTLNVTVKDEQFNMIYNECYT